MPAANINRSYNLISRPTGDKVDTKSMPKIPEPIKLPHTSLLKQSHTKPKFISEEMKNKSPQY